LLYRSSISDRFREIGSVYEQESGTDLVWDNVLGVVFFSKTAE
jgi:hypothetical protein